MGGSRKGPETLPLDMGGQEIQNVQCSRLTPRPNGTADPGATHEIADAGHVHQGSDPVVEGAYLFPAYIPDLYLRPAVRALGQFGEGYGWAWLNWTQISGSAGTYVWRANSVGTIQLYGLSGVIVAALNDRILCLNGGPAGIPSAYDGIYQVLDAGSASTPAVIRRVLDANTSSTFGAGMVVEVDGDADARFYGTYWRILTAGAIDVVAPTWENVETYTSQATQRTLTSAQIVTQGASLTEYQANTGVTSGTPSGVAFFYTPTLPGTPGAASIPAGNWTVTVKGAMATGGDAGATSVLKACFGLVAAGWVFADGLPTPFLTVTSQPLTSTATDITIPGTIPTDVSCTPDQRLLWWWEAATTSATTVTVAFTWQDAARTTRVATTLQFPAAGGTNWHPDMLGRDQPHQHPDSAIDDTIGSATISAEGRVDIGTAKTLLVDPAGRQLGLMQTPTLAAGMTAFRRLIFSGATKLHNAAVPSTGYSPLKLARGGTQKDVITFPAAWALAEFTFVPALGAWVLGANNTT